MNYLLPVQVGAPDYLNYLIKDKLTWFYFMIINKFNLYFYRSNTKVSTHLPCLKLEAYGLKLSGAALFFSTKVNTSQSIGSYLAGLFEGDGHVSLPKVANLTGKITYPYLAITFVNKDLPLVNQLKELYGGRLRFKTEENAIVWIIGTHKELIVLINLMNGYLRTPKINKFNDLILWLNERYHYNIPIHYVDSSSLNSNGWLSCFIEADGAFKVRCLQLKNG